MDYTVHGILQARLLEWVAFRFCRGSSQPRDWTQVSHIAGGCFTSWATREAHFCWWVMGKRQFAKMWFQFGFSFCFFLEHWCGFKKQILYIYFSNLYKSIYGISEEMTYINLIYCVCILLPSMDVGLFDCSPIWVIYCFYGFVINNPIKDILNMSLPTVTLFGLDPHK